MDFLLLPALVVFPMLAAVLCALVGQRLARAVAVPASVVQLLLAGVAAARFDWELRSEQLNAVLGEFAPLGISLRLAADPLSLLLAVLTAVLAVSAVLASLSRPGGAASKDNAFYGWLLLLVGVMTGVWLARDLLLFYAFFELVLVPLYFLIGTFGGVDRRQAATKLFVYTFAGSVLALPAILFVGLSAGTFDMAEATRWAQTQLTDTQRLWVLAGLLASFCIKTPLFPLHTWQPLAMAESPGDGVVDAVGLVLKLGAYAMLKVALPIGLLSSDGLAAAGAHQLLALLAAVGVVYGALCAWVQSDVKRLLAYSSVSHVGLIVLGILALTDLGLRAASLYLLNTAIITGALFLSVGMVYRRFGTRDLGELSGLGRVMPVGAFFIGLFTMAAIGLPLLNGFVSEFLTILATFRSPYLGLGFGVVAASGIVLGAIYMLSMLARLLFGPLKHPAVAGGGAVRDLNAREVTALMPLALLVLVLGVFPQPVLQTLERSVAPLRAPIAAWERRSELAAGGGAESAKSAGSGGVAMRDAEEGSVRTP